jgi:cell fate (sporulation/competence/biofilm development) regulator YlbF (YheA/YmcA/DUF963 family)
MFSMELNKEIVAAARSFGQALRKDTYIQAYLEAVADIQADQEARTLEKRLYDLFDMLSARQHAGEQLSHAEIDEFYQLRAQVQAHPSISKRDAILRVLNPFLAETADEISGQLGVDYVNMVTGAR